jgi:hypothetical protein
VSRAAALALTAEIPEKGNLQSPSLDDMRLYPAAHLPLPFESRGAAATTITLNV